jgi:peptide/nickel transport system substrate-binding protein
MSSRPHPARRIGIGGRPIALFLAALVAVGTATACSSSPSPSTSASGGSGKTLTVGLTTLGTENSLPWLMTGTDFAVWSEVYDTLAVTPAGGKSLEPVPDLATSWSHSADLKTWTFKLRHGVQFQQGYGPLTSADVVYTFDKYLNPQLTSASANSIRADIQSVSATGPYTVVFHLTAPNAMFIWDVTNGVEIASKKYITKVGAAAADKHPIGTGAYELAASVPGSSYTFTAVPDGWHKTPGFQTLKLVSLPDPSSALAALQSGEVDIIPTSGDYLSQAKSAGFRVIEEPNTQPEWVVLQGTDMLDPKDDCTGCAWVGNPSNATSAANALKVRQALDYAIDRQAIAKDVWDGYGSTSAFGYWILPGFAGWSASWTTLPYNPSKAKQLLAEAGYPNGFTINMVTASLNPDTAAVTQAIVQYWGAIGVKVNLSQITEGALADSAITRTNEAFVYGPPAAVTPAILPAEISSKSALTFNANTPALDALAGQIKASDNSASLIGEAGDTLVSGQWGIPIGIRSGTWAVSKRVGTWEMQPDDPITGNYAYIQPAS